MSKHYIYTFTVQSSVYGLYFTSVISYRKDRAKDTLVGRDHLSASDKIEFISKRPCLL